MGVRVIAVDEAAILKWFGASASAHYLAEYLQELGATTAVIEERYVDRHYLDDYVEFYARSFDAPQGQCARIHFFCLDEAGLEQQLRASCSSADDRKAAEELLQLAYRGFVVRRPLESAAMGRTVLATYPSDGRQRRYSAVRPYRVHLMGLPLEAEGLAYQQQDGGAAVCASTALWSAFQQTAKLCGQRTPTPAAVTRAAQSPFPAAHGLGDGEMARAIASLGYSADRFTPAGNTALFRAQMGSFLRSRLPVVFLLGQSNGIGHAVTVTGHRAAEPGMVQMGDARFLSRSANTEVVYVHDDNLGSHAHYELLSAANERLDILRGRSVDGGRPWWRPDTWEVDGALVPKPPKIRLPIEQLYQLVLQIRFRFSDLLQGIDADEALVHDAYYTSGQALRQQVHSSGYSPAAKLAWQKGVDLPRHVAVVEVSDLTETPLVEFLFDATTLIHHQERPLAVLAPGVVRESEAGALLARISEQVLFDACSESP